jgi:serine/threonine protein kinase
MRQQASYHEWNSLAWITDLTANIMRKHGGRIVIVDFGLSKSSQQAKSGATQTSAGEFQGTIAYSSPEQHSCQELTLASDVFAMAIILYEAITAKLPFGSEGMSTSSSRTTLEGIYGNVEQSIFRVNVVKAPAAPLTPEEAPGSIDTFILQCLEKNPADRVKDANAMREKWSDALDKAAEVLRRGDLPLSPTVSLTTASDLCGSSRVFTRRWESSGLILGPSRRRLRRSWRHYPLTSSGDGSSKTGMKLRCPNLGKFFARSPPLPPSQQRDLESAVPLNQRFSTASILP